MKTICKAFTLLGVVLFYSCSENKKIIEVEEGVWIKNVTIISPESTKIIPYLGNVVLDHDTIAYVGKDNIVLSGSYEKIDATGKYIIPGLIDSHVHLSSIAGMNYRHARAFPELTKSYFEQLPKSYLYFGYTTLIDPNNYSPKTIQKLKNNKISPEIYTCGEQVKVMNDFMMAEEAPKDRYRFYPRFLHDKYNANVVLPDSIDLKMHSVEKVVSTIVYEQDGICLKTIYEDGFGGTEKMTWELPSINIIKDLVQEAKNEGVPVLLHANSFAAQKFGSQANVDIIAHGMWHWGPIKEYLPIANLPQKHKDVLSKIATQQIGYQPTFRVIAGQRDVFDPMFIEDSNLENVYPSDLLKWLKSEEGLWQKKRILTYGGDIFNVETPDLEIAKLMQSMVDKINVSCNHLYKEQGNLLFGSDTPAMNTHTNPPGYNGYLEMQEWIKAGVSLEDVFKSATINNAKEFNIDNLFGSIETGKRANLILMNVNPLQEVEAYNNIFKVILRGEVYDRQEFSAKHQ